MAGTILFLASKIEEEPLKLRHICNTCLVKFENDPEGGWHPSDDHGVNPDPPLSSSRSWMKADNGSHPLQRLTDAGRRKSWPQRKSCSRRYVSTSA